ncbi:MAG: hypothetical protein GX868_18395 [Actinobacteria bacterium]|nr:hypothetical protein [Actinomycetota bacterium]
MYHQFAVHIANGKGYANWRGDPTSYYPPGYPWFLGVQQTVLQWLGAEGSLHRVAPVVQALLGGVAVWALIGAASTLDANPQRGRRIGLAAGVVLALWPNLVLHSATLLSESLFIVCLCLFLLGMTRLMVGEAALWTRPWWRNAVLAGVALGAATLTRPQVLLSLPAFAVAIGVLRVPWRTRAALFLVPAVLGAAVVMPWTIRNAALFGEFVPVSTNGGDNLCIGFNRDARGHWFAPETCETGDFYQDGPEAEARRNHDASQIAKEWISNNRSRLPWLSWRKLVYTYDNDVDGLRAVEGYGSDEFLAAPVRRGLRLASNGYYLVTMGFAAVGLSMLIVRVASAARSPRRRDATTSIGLAVVVGGVASALVPILFFGEARFKVPSTPFFAMFAAVALAALWERAVLRRHDAPSATDGGATPRADAAAS